MAASSTQPSHYTALGGAGAWHPQRQLSTQGPSEAEANLAVLHQEAAGLKLYTQLCGYGGSSTRLEIAGAIVGLAADGAMHLGTDSKSFMAKALSVHQHINNNTLPKRPWAIQTDGDMWHMYFRHAAAKHTAAIAISKVKGHATQSMIDQGTVVEADKIGNDKADEAADEGVELFGEAVVRLSRHFAKRHAAYSRLVGDIHEHVAFMFRVRAALLHKQQLAQPTDHTATKPQNHPTITIRLPPHQPNRAQSPTHFTQIIRVQQCSKLCQRLPAVVRIQEFLLAMPMFPIGDRCSIEGDRAGGSMNASSAEAADDNTHEQSTMGCTWLELYALYRLAGHPEPKAYQKDAATPRPTLKQQLHTFQQATRQLVTNTMGQQQQHLFKGKRERHGKRLSTLGINTNVAILPWQPDLTEATRQRVAQEILRSQYRVSPQRASSILQQQQTMPLRQAQLKGRSKWSSSIKATKQPLYCSPYPAEPEPPTTLPHDQHHPIAPALPTIAFFRCPRCTHQLPATKTAFDQNHLDTRVWCNSCRKSLFVRQWQCACQLPWHTCPKHCTEPQRLRAQAPHPAPPTTTADAPPRPRPKRVLGRGQDERIRQWLDQPAAKRRRPEPPADIDLGECLPGSEQATAAKRVKAHLLGPRLMAKFPRLAREAAWVDSGETCDITQCSNHRPRGTQPGGSTDPPSTTTRTNSIVARTTILTSTMPEQETAVIEPPTKRANITQHDYDDTPSQEHEPPLDEGWVGGCLTAELSATNIPITTAHHTNSLTSQLSTMQLTNPPTAEPPSSTAQHSEQSHLS